MTKQTNETKDGIYEAMMIRDKENLYIRLTNSKKGEKKKETSLTFNIKEIDLIKSLLARDLKYLEDNQKVTLQLTSVIKNGKRKNNGKCLIITTKMKNGLPTKIIKTKVLSAGLF